MIWSWERVGSDCRLSISGAGEARALVIRTEVKTIFQMVPIVLLERLQHRMRDLVSVLLYKNHSVDEMVKILLMGPTGRLQEQV